MNRRLAILICTVAFLAAGCRSFNLTMPNGTKIKTFTLFNNTSIGEARVNPDGSGMIKGYGSDQTSVVEAATRGAVQGALIPKQP